MITCIIFTFVVINIIIIIIMLPLFVIALFSAQIVIDMVKTILTFFFFTFHRDIPRIPESTHPPLESSKYLELNFSDVNPFLPGFCLQM